VTKSDKIVSSKRPLMAVSEKNAKSRRARFHAVSEREKPPKKDGS
jgi:hypothetical protein